MNGSLSTNYRSKEFTQFCLVVLAQVKPLLLSVHQCLLRLFKSTKIDPLKPCVCLGAFTAAAERNVGGATLHILLAKPTNSERALAMVFETQSRLRNQYSQLRVLIIDEISLVGNYFLHIIDQHLRRIKNCDEPFDGVTEICFGDIFQLHPPPLSIHTSSLSRQASKNCQLMILCVPGSNYTR